MKPLFLQDLCKESTKRVEDLLSSGQMRRAAKACVRGEDSSAHKGRPHKAAVVSVLALAAVKLQG